MLAVIGRHLPSALRTFLLTLAVVDDLLAIIIIAVFYTTHLSVAARCSARWCRWPLFTVLVQRRVRSWWLLLPLAAAAWALVHASGVHATVAGVLLGFAVPVVRSATAGGPDAGPGLAEHFEHRFRPLSAGVAVPVFAFFVRRGHRRWRSTGLAASLTDRVAIGIVVGLVVGKPVGIMAATWLVARFTRADLDEGLAWLDVLGLAILGGIGFTVSLLIGELAFGVGTEQRRPRQDRASWPARSPPRCWPASSCGSAEPRLPADRTRRRASTRTATASRTSTSRTGPVPCPCTA